MAEPPVDRPENTGEEAAESRRGEFELSRRTFLGGAVTAAGIAYLQPFGGARLRQRTHPHVTTHPTSTADSTADIAIKGGGPDIVLSVERPDDLVLLDFSFYGFQFQTGTPTTIVPTESNNTIVVQFPPQAIAEGEYFWHPQTNGDNDLVVDPPPVLSQVSGPSQLCFNLQMTQSIPLPTMTAADLLDWSTWFLVVPVAAQVNGPTFLLGTLNATADPRAPSPPAALETAIEFPYALYLAPVVYESGIAFDGFSTEFTSRAEPLVSPAGVTDLWSASLTGRRVDIILEGGAPYVPPVSAFWSRDLASPFLEVPSATPEEFIVYGQPLIIP